MHIDNFEPVRFTYNMHFFELNYHIMVERDWRAEEVPGIFNVFTLKQILAHGKAYNCKHGDKDRKILVARPAKPILYQGNLCKYVYAVLVQKRPNFWTFVTVCPTHDLSFSGIGNPCRQGLAFQR